MAAALCLGLLAALVGVNADAEGDRVLVLGVIHDNVEAVKTRLEPMADYAQHKLADLGIEDVLIVVAQDVRHMADLLAYDRVDWITETPFNAIVLEGTERVQIVARTWRTGSPTYRSLFFVRNDSRLNALADLPDARIAFEQPASTSAFFVPAIEVIDQSLTLCHLSHPRQTANDDCVGYAFAGNAFNTAAWVHKKIVDVGVFSTTDWESADAMPAAFKKDFRILHESNSIPRGLELLRANLDDKIKDRLQQILLEMHQDPKARPALQAYFETRKFDALTSDDVNALSRLRESLPAFERSIY